MRSIKVIENHKISIHVIEKYKDKINWELLSRNINIDWNGLPNETLKSYCNWKSLSDNFGINFEIDKLEIFKNYIDWYYYSRNQSALLNYKTLLKFSEFWNWDDLSLDSSLILDQYLIEECFTKIEASEKFQEYKYKSQYFWDAISESKNLYVGIGFVIKNVDKLNLQNIAKNTSIKIDDKDLDLFIDEILHQENGERFIFEFFKSICDSHNAISVFLNINKYSRYIEWESFTRNELIHWSEYEINKNRDKISWYGLTRNKNFRISFDFIKKNERSFDFGHLSSAENVQWTTYLISYFIERWDWNELSNNKSILWTEEMIYSFNEYLNWGNCEKSNYFNLYDGISANTSITWTVEIIKAHKNKINFDCISGVGKLDPEVLNKIEISKLINFDLLSSNKNFLWSDELIKKFEFEIDIFKIAHNKKIINNTIAEIILKNIDSVTPQGTLGDYERQIGGKDWLVDDDVLIDAILKYKEDLCISTLNDVPHESMNCEDNAHPILDIEAEDFFKDKENNTIGYAKEFFTRNKELCSKIISYSIDFDGGELEKYRELLSWNYLSRNIRIKWSPELIRKYCNQIVWSSFTTTISDYEFCNIGFIKEFKNYIDWRCAKNINSLPWNFELVELALASDQVSLNDLIKCAWWSLELTLEFENIIDFKIFTEFYDWDEESYEIFKDKIDKNYVLEILKSKATDEEWNGYEDEDEDEDEDVDVDGDIQQKSSIRDFLKKLNLLGFEPNDRMLSFDNLIDYLNSEISRGEYVNWNLLSKNLNFENHIDIIRYYKKHLNWTIVCDKHGHQLNAQLVEEFGPYLDWKALVENKKTTVTMQWLDRNRIFFDNLELFPSNIDGIFQLNSKSPLLIRDNLMLSIALGRDETRHLSEAFNR